MNMKNLLISILRSTLLTNAIALIIFTAGCNITTKHSEPADQDVKPVQNETPEYFSLRPETEKAFGYAHAVKIGDDIKISGAVSMDDAGVPTAVGDLLQQMKNCYSDLDKVLKHYGCTFDDVVVENIFTTNMPEFLKQSAYRNTIYTRHFPTGSWLGVKELALPEFMIEIELEVYITR
jgi:2-iminobutanoate/2-iminopropanoate deaminase